MKRRDFLKLMGIVSGGAVMSSCDFYEPRKTLMAHLMPPKEGIPGVSMTFPTTCTECPANCGLMVRIRDGQPFKLEGLPGHPINDGALCLRGQASLARLLHPERVTGPLARQADGSLSPIGWDEALRRISTQADATTQTPNVYLAGRTTGSLSTLIDEFCNRRSFNRLPELEMFSHGALRSAYDLLFNRRILPHYDFSQADVLLSIGADLMETFISPVNFGRQFSRAKTRGMQWFHVDPHVSLTGIRSDHYLQVTPGCEADLLAFLLRELPHRRPLPESLQAALPIIDQNTLAQRSGIPLTELNHLVSALRQARRPLVLTGGVSTATDHGQVTALLAALVQWSQGMIGETVDLNQAENYESVGTPAELEAFATEHAGSAPGVAILSRIYSLAHLPGLAAYLKSARLRVAMTDFLYPATTMCDLILPLSHSLESWGDTETRQGVFSLIRPVFSPLHDTRTEGDILLSLMGTKSTYKDYLDAHWTGHDASWIDDAFMVKTGPSVDVNPVFDRTVEYLRTTLPVSLPPLPVLYVVPSLRTFDGRSRVITLLHEIPDPLSAISYGEPAGISPSDARQRNMKTGDGITLKIRGQQINKFIHLQQNLPPGVMLCAVDAIEDLQLPLDRNSGEFIRRFSDINIDRNDTRKRLPVLAGSMLSSRHRDILPGHRSPEREEHKPPEGADVTVPIVMPEHPSLYPTRQYQHYRWALAVDLDKCTGCTACVGACYVENNIAITGVDEHLKGREMSWIRIEPHQDDTGHLNFLPVMCQHCDDAPCEPVCPVYATFHDSEGLNEQVYNRCVGTRYCSNNCPYKARRFNWFEHHWEKPLDIMLNPDVSVRPKGVMEKCTFCIQRIRLARDHAKDEGRLVQDGEVTTACAQTCPTGAIVFGNLLDPASRIYQLAQSGRAYNILGELGTRPGVYYLSDKMRVKE